MVSSSLLNNSISESDMCVDISNRAEMRSQLLNEKLRRMQQYLDKAEIETHETVQSEHTEKYHAKRDQSNANILSPTNRKRAYETKDRSPCTTSKRLKSESADNEAIANIYSGSQNTDGWNADEETIDAIEIYVNKCVDVNAMDGVTTEVIPIVRENILVPTQSLTESLIEILSNTAPKNQNKLDVKQLKATNKKKKTSTQSVVRRSQRRHLHTK